jgi:Putative DNA-binding domain
MREPWEWQESDILSLIENNVPESPNLEFKASAALTNKGWKNEFAKDISAFANSAGGTLIYGIREGADTHEAESIDEGFDPLEFKKERLEQVINSTVQRRIEGIKYHPVPLTTTNPNRILFVIHVPESSQSPHMANNRYYKRFQFESVYMDEYEVRERYGRVTFPGKDVVEAWRDDAINPLISTLEGAADRLSSEKWTWNHYERAFGGLNEIGEHGQYSANAEDFLSRHSDIGDLLYAYDAALQRVNGAGEVLFDKVAKSSFIRDVFAYTTSEDSLLKLAAENVNRFKVNTSAEIYAELFGMDQIEQERFDHFAEWAINGSKPTNNIEVMLIFWRTYGDRFRNLVIYPPLNEYRRNVEKARQELVELGQSLITKLKIVRTELSERHNVALQAARSSVANPYDSLWTARKGLVANNHTGQPTSAMLSVRMSGHRCRPLPSPDPKR